jgi:AcrR family transcriptional regulator
MVLTAKGQATRERIVVAAADLVLARGAAGTSLDEIRARTHTSKSQLFHYFPEGKRELVLALAELQVERVLDAQRPHLEALDTWEAWEGWREALLTHYGAQSAWGCPVAALASELAGADPDAAAIVAGHLERWRGYLRDGISRMTADGTLDPETDAEHLSLAMFAALQGGLLLTRALQSPDPLGAALDGALTHLYAYAAEE